MTLYMITLTDCPLFVATGLPNTIRQDIHPNIRLKGNLPAGYSAGTIPLLLTLSYLGF